MRRRRFRLQLGVPGPSSPAWVLAESATAPIFSFISLVLIGRAIGPEAAGVGAVAVAVFLLLDILAASLFTEALIQRPVLTRLHADSAITAATLVGVAAGVALALVGPPLLSGPSAPEMRSIILVLAALLPISAFANAVIGLLLRAQRLRLLALRVLIGQPAAVVVALLAARAGLGAWAMVSLQVVGMLTGFLLVLCCGRLGLRPRLDVAAIRELLPVAGPQSVATMVESTKYRIFILALGVLLRDAIIAQSHFAFRLMDAALFPVWQIGTRLSLPRLCALQDDPEPLAEAYGDLAQLQALLGLPIAIGIALTVPDIVQALLGPAWLGTADAARIVGFAAAAFLLVGNYSSLFVAVGRTRWNLYIATGSIALQMTSLLALQPATAAGIACAWAVPSFVLPPLLTWMVLRELRRPPLWLARRIAPAATATAAMAVAVLLVQDLMRLPAVSELLVSVVAGAAAFGIVAWLTLGRRLPLALQLRAVAATC